MQKSSYQSSQLVHSSSNSLLFQSQLLGVLELQWDWRQIFPLRADELLYFFNYSLKV